MQTQTISRAQRRSKRLNWRRVKCGRSYQNRKCQKGRTFWAEFCPCPEKRREALRKGLSTIYSTISSGQGQSVRGALHLYTSSFIGSRYPVCGRVEMFSHFSHDVNPAYVQCKDNLIRKFFVLPKLEDSNLLGITEDQYLELLLSFYVIFDAGYY